ncbi:MAG: type IX secretion system membrane protein PorP/SprF [Saprospiraceae bacterium]
MHIGAWARPTNDIGGKWNMDAIVTMLGLEHQNFLLGFSYDISPSQLGLNNRSRNTFEISAAYLGEYEDETVLCPKF